MAFFKAILIRTHQINRLNSMSLPPVKRSAEKKSSKAMKRLRRVPMTLPQFNSSPKSEEENPTKRSCSSFSY
jgi:hypothetical protein